MSDNKIIACGISENCMWNDGRDFWANSTAKNGREARDFAASEWEAARLGIEQCCEMGCVISCGGETGQDETEAGGRTARQAGNIFATVNARTRRYR